jgi:hypothetical protein
MIVMNILHGARQLGGYISDSIVNIF